MQSGHDTTYRLDGTSAHLNPVDLNALLYRYEVDIATTIRYGTRRRRAGPGEGAVRCRASHRCRAA